jgi:UDP-glucose 4-epimerase
VHVVVTGGAGFIGSHLVDALLCRRFVTVMAIDNLHRGRLVNLAHHDGDTRFAFASLDIRDASALDEAFHGADVVYHLAAQSNVMGAVGDPRYSFEANVVGTFNVLEAALRCRVRRVVFASSRETYGEPRQLPVTEDHPLVAKNTYGASKVAAEAYCRTFTNVFGLETAVLRFANVYGPRDFDRVIPIWLGRALDGKPLELYGGDQVIDFVWVDQAVEALIRASTADIVGIPINVASGTGTPIRELAVRILDVTGSRSAIHVNPSRHAEVMRFVADTRRMHTLLGIEPPGDPLEYLPRMVGPTTTRTS